MDIFSYKPDSDVLIEFFNSDAVVKLICGPPGSGKSVAWVAEMFYNCIRQQPDDKGRRRVKFGIVRKTFRRLKTTTRKTVVQWIPDELGTVTQSPPMHGTIKFPHPTRDGTTCELELDFIALETEVDLENLDSYEATGFVVNELSELEKYQFTKLIERIGRYPPPKDGARATEPVLIGDFNPQSREHWLHSTVIKGGLNMDDMEELDATGISEIHRPLLAYFEQPPAAFCDNFDAADQGKEPPRIRVNPNADNINNVGLDYYKNQIALRLKAQEWDTICRRYFMLWRSVVRGKRCHPEFDKLHHVSQEALTAAEDDIIFGFDTSGIHPAACIGQVVNGQARVYLVLYAGEMGLDEFISNVLVPTLRARFPDRRYVAVPDPANARDNRTATSPTVVLRAEYGISSIVLKSNSFNVRKRAVAKVCNRRNGLLVDVSADDTTVVKNNQFVDDISSNYVHKKIPGVFMEDGEPAYENKPDNKGEPSHPIDAFQYFCMFCVGLLGEYSDNATGGKPVVKVKKKRLI